MAELDMSGNVLDACARSDVLEAVHEFTKAFDRRDGAGMKRWFLADGIWHRLVGAVRGHDGVDTLIAGLTPGFFCRHIISNWSIALDGPDRATCHTYMTVFRSDGAEPPAVPLAIEGALHAMGECADTLVREDGRWKIASRRFSPIYTH